MIKYAFREIRHHPRRLIATWLSIALSVAFIVATQVLARNELLVQTKISYAEALGADLIVGVPPGNHTDSADASKVTPAFTALRGAVVEPVYTSGGVVTSGDQSTSTSITGIPASEALRQGRIVDGRWPEKTAEFVATRSSAKLLHIDLGGHVTFQGSQMTLVGYTDDPESRLLSGRSAVIRVPASFFEGADAGLWMVKVPAGTAVVDAQKTLDAALAASGAGAVRALATHDFLMADAESLGNVNPLEIFASAFGVLSLVVGTIMISTTFTILIAQRRRQIALLRMIGASTSQVRGSLLVEALTVGLVGSLLGVGLGFGAAAGVAAWEGSLGLGLEFSPLVVALAFVAGVLTAAVAAWVPVLRTSRIAPMEAIREGVTQQTKSFSVIRLILCALLVLAGVGLSVMALQAPSSSAFILALAASAVLTFGVLAASPLFVPPLLRGLGVLLRPLGPIARLAASNASRNAARSAATATALMLAVGLVVTLQVATATAKGAAIREIESRYSLDVSVTSINGALPQTVSDKLQETPGVAASTVVQGTVVNRVGSGGQVRLYKHTAELDSVLPSPLAVDATHALVGSYFFGPSVSAGDVTLVTTTGQRLTIHAKTSAVLNSDEVLLDEQTYASFAGESQPLAVWMKVPDKGDSARVATAVQNIADGNVNLMTSGSLLMSAQLIQILDTLLMVATVLSAVAVIIALIGVGNTLGLSVLERTRESALLRALGLQRAGLRGALALEALVIGVVGVGVGVAAGVWFGWFGATAALRTGDLGEPTLVVDPATTGVLVAIALVTALLASVIPGRRAAKATPVEALAEVG